MINSEVLNEVHSGMHEGIHSGEQDRLVLLRDTISEIYSHSFDEDERDNLRHEVSNSILGISSVLRLADNNDDEVEQETREKTHLYPNKPQKIISMSPRRSKSRFSTF